MGGAQSQPRAVSAATTSATTSATTAATTAARTPAISATAPNRRFASVGTESGRNNGRTASMQSIRAQSEQQKRFKSACIENFFVGEDFPFEEFERKAAVSLGSVNLCDWNARVDVAKELYSGMRAAGNAKIQGTGLYAAQIDGAIGRFTDYMASNGHPLQAIRASINFQVGAIHMNTKWHDARGLDRVLFVELCNPAPTRLAAEMSPKELSDTTALDERALVCRPSLGTGTYFSAAAMHRGPLSGEIGMKIRCVLVVMFAKRDGEEYKVQGEYEHAEAYGRGGSLTSQGGGGKRAPRRRVAKKEEHGSTSRSRAKPRPPKRSVVG